MGKTNQFMSVGFSKGQIDIFNKTMMGNLTQLVTLGNKFRLDEDKKLFNLAQFLKKDATNSFIETLKLRKNLTHDEVIKVMGKGSNKATYANIYLLLYVAQNMSDDFNLEMMDVFIEQKILELRDNGADDFKTLNMFIDGLKDRSKELKPKGNKGCYITVAKMLRSKIFTAGEIAKYGNNANIWNSPAGDAISQKLRVDYESELIVLMKRGYISTFDEVKAFIEKL